MTDSPTFNRRQALLGTAAAGATAAIGFAPSVDAKAPMAKSQASYWYRFPVGKFQATIISDGPLALGKPSDTMKGMPDAELNKLLGDNFLSLDSIVLEQNILVLNTGRAWSCSTAAWASRRRSAPPPAAC